jgi:uncharacterized coiled-coil protein SlyX
MMNECWLMQKLELNAEIAEKQTIIAGYQAQITLWEDELKKTLFEIMLRRLELWLEIRRSKRILADLTRHVVTLQEKLRELNVHENE